jgi:hypothetical protein
MIETITPYRIVKARKEYHDMCREYITAEPISPGLLTFKELRQIAIAKQNGWKIKKGELYEFGVFKYDGEIYAFRSHIGLAGICQKYELWPEV